MSTLSRELDRYLTIRRSLGYGLRRAERDLRRFVAFAEKERAKYITTDLFLRWRNAFGHAGRGTWAARLGMVRLFAQWLQGMNSRHEVPPQSLIPHHCRRPRPYIYSPEEIRSIIYAAAKLPSIDGIRGITFSTLFGLIAVTGLRISEAVALDDEDFDRESGVLAIRHGKLGKARLLPLSESTQSQLAIYAKERDRLLGARPKAFFVSDRGERISTHSAEYNFVVVCQGVGLRPAQRFHRWGHGPRIHDLRHTFAVNTLLNWYRKGKDAAPEMLRLTTYLGHTKPVDTYWYIEAVPELLKIASKRVCASLAKEARV